MGLINQLLHGKEGIIHAYADENAFEITDEIRSRLQKEILSIYDDVNALCEKHHLDLFLVGGSLLGAVRHHGFIPWDEDMDCSMTRRDFTTFSNVFQKELGDKYILNAPVVSATPKTRFVRIIKKGTLLREINSSPDYEYQGISIDIFLTENAPDNRLLRNIKGSFCNILEFISGQVYFRENLTQELKAALLHSGKANYYTRMIIGWVFSFFSSVTWFNILDRAIRCPDDTSKYCTIATGRRHYFGELLPRDVFFPLKTASFGERTVKIPNNADAYLKNMYGDYMVIPPAEKRERHLICELDFGDGTSTL